MLSTEEIVHPRPQLAREGWIDLEGIWDFAYDDDDAGLREEWVERPEVFDCLIRVPYPPESPASGIGDTGFHPIVWYRRTFTAVSAGENRRLLLHFGAVDYRARVWVNGRLVATHEGGHTPFYADITDALGSRKDHALVVRAEDQPEDLAQPRGKQDWQAQPHEIWYYRTTGIWQPVWLEWVGRYSIRQLRWTADLQHHRLGLALRLERRDQAPLSLRVQISMHGRVLADDTSLVLGTDPQRQIALDVGSLSMDHRTLRWSPEHPNLLDARLTLQVGDEVVDQVRSYAGLRSVGVANGRFLLNERPYYLRLALEQGYWPASHLAAPDGEALRREVELAKQIGFNGVRIHQKVEDPRFLYWCDRLGLLVWGEMANTYVFSPTAIERTTREWLEVLARDYSHPCIVAWVPLNESWGVPDLAIDPAQQRYAQALYALTKALDPTRPALANDGWEYVAGDICGIHDYSFDGAILRNRYGSATAMANTMSEVQPQHRVVVVPGQRLDGVPIMLTEYGGLSFRPTSDEAWHGYGTVTTAAEYLVKFAELTDALLDSPAIAGFCYTQLTDTRQETNGLLTAERAFKLDAAKLRAIITRVSAGVPGDITIQQHTRTGSGPATGSLPLKV